MVPDNTLKPKEVCESNTVLGSLLSYPGVLPFCPDVRKELKQHQSRKICERGRETWTTSQENPVNHQSTHTNMVDVVPPVSTPAITSRAMPPASTRAGGEQW